jgi:hypothetical protein
MAQKSINKFALALWIVAAVLVLADIPMVIALKQAILNNRYPDGVQYPVLWSSIWTEARWALFYGMQLAGLGVLIEIADQIRWNALNRSK